MDESKKLNVIVITDFTDFGDAAVRYGSVVAAIFNASLTIVGNYIPHKKFINHKKRTSETLSPHFRRSLENLSDHSIETILLSDPFTASELYQYADETNTVMFVIAVSSQKNRTTFNRKKAFSFIKPSRHPVLVVGNQMPGINIFKLVLLPIDIYLNSKEKAMWAGYFHRYYQAPVHIIYSLFKDEFLLQKVKDNLAFVEKLYQNLNINYALHPITPPVDNIDYHSMKIAPQFQATLTVIMMTRYRSLTDLLLGVKEKKMIGNPIGFPVLCLNERDDLYVLCT